VTRFPETSVFFYHTTFFLCSIHPVKGCNNEHDNSHLSLWNERNFFISWATISFSNWIMFRGVTRTLHANAFVRAIRDVSACETTCACHNFIYVSLFFRYFHTIRLISTKSCTMEEDLPGEVLDTWTPPPIFWKPQLFFFSYCSRTIRPSVLRSFAFDVT
jgi:hypothetical protein